ncbi:hypothetical protein D3C71_1438420 [compost metagenome]
MSTLPERSGFNHLAKAGTQTKGHRVQVLARLAKRSVAGFGEDLVLSKSPWFLEMLAAFVFPLFEVVAIEIASLDTEVATHHVQQHLHQLLSHGGTGQRQHRVHLALTCSSWP